MSIKTLPTIQNSLTSSNSINHSIHLRWWMSCIIFISILAFAIYARWNTFWLPHWQGDQSQYITLAMKMRSVPGLSGYNLREVRIFIMRLKQAPDQELTHPLYEKGVEGDLIRVYRDADFAYYDMPLFYKAPLLPAFLAFSHRWLTGGNHPYLVLKTNLGDEVYNNKSMTIFHAQFWVSIVPLAFSLLAICLTFFFARYLFGTIPAFYAMFILAMNPVVLLSSHRVWTENLMAFFITASLFVFWIYFNKRNVLGVFGAGLLLGYAVLSNQKSALAAFAVIAYIFFATNVKQWNMKTLISFLLNKYVIFFLAGMFFISASWFVRVNHVYDNPLWRPFWEPSVKTDAANVKTWIDLLRSRPHAMIVYPIGVVFLCPPLIAGYFAIKPMAIELLRRFQGWQSQYPYWFCFLWALSFVGYYIMKSPYASEHRYLVPAYPAFVMLAGVMITKFQFRLSKYFQKPLVGHIIVVSAVVLSAFWSIPLGMESVLTERNLIMKPF